MTEKGFLKIRLSKGGKVKITLEVKAKKLYEYLNTIVPPNKPEPSTVDSCCKLRDNNYGKTKNSKVADFVSQVYLHKNVKWVGKSNDKEYSIAIDSIVYHSKSKDTNDVNFFNDKTIFGSGGENSIVEARVKEDLRLINKEDIYTINCSVYKDASNKKSFHIDPKLGGNI
ncbi:hypothetical protein [Flavobacterium sp. A45]|uniref:hypothetical protein n=1 Tax=Flavobacterium sp. A45 TaxID=1945862 RepID=UPI000F515297|nr:hypothetical protein [Flavobacterium sp. A45]